MKNILLALLAVLCLYLFVSMKLKERRLEQNAALEAGLQKQITLQGRKIIYKRREAGAQTYYLPPEGGLDIRQNDGGEVQIKVKNKGLALRPYAGFSAATNSNFEPAFGARFLYWSRWGLGAAWAAKSGPMLTLDRRIDDIIPQIQNTSLMLLGNKQTIGIGVAVYL